MYCSKCGTENVKDSKFCTKCGASLTGETKEKSVLLNQVKDKAGKTTMVCLEYLKLIMNFILKPATSLKGEISKLDNFTNSGILALIIAVVSTLVSLINTMINTVVVKQFDWTEGYVTVWKWENLKDIDYISIIFESLIYVLLVIAVIAGIYYIASLIVKKDVKFPRLIGLTSLSITPLLLTSLVISPILSIVSAEIAAVAVLVGSLYTILMIHETINNEFKLEGNIKYYFNLACYSVLLIISYIVLSKIVFSTITSSANGILDMIK